MPTKKPKKIVVKTTMVNAVVTIKLRFGKEWSMRNTRPKAMAPRMIPAKPIKTISDVFMPELYLQQWSKILTRTSVLTYLPMITMGIMQAESESDQAKSR